MALYHIWLVDKAAQTLAHQSTRHRSDAATREALRALDDAFEASGAVFERQHHVAALAIRKWSGRGEVVALVDDRHELHLFRG